MKVRGTHIPASVKKEIKVRWCSCRGRGLLILFHSIWNQFFFPNSPLFNKLMESTFLAWTPKLSKESRVFHQKFESTKHCLQSPENILCSLIKVPCSLLSIHNFVKLLFFLTINQCTLMFSFKFTLNKALVTSRTIFTKALLPGLYSNYTLFIHREKGNQSIFL